MAYSEYSETYVNAYVDLEKNAIIEVFDGETNVYDLDEFLSRMSVFSPLRIHIESIGEIPEDRDDCDDNDDCQGCEDYDKCYYDNKYRE